MNHIWRNEVDYKISQKIDKNVDQIFIYIIFINRISSMIYSVLQKGYFSPGDSGQIGGAVIIVNL